MVDSVQVFPPGYRVLDATGEPVNGAMINFRLAGPGAAMNVYSDKDLTQSLGSTVYTRSDGYPVASQGSNTTVEVYVGTAPYWVEITDSAGASLYPAKDNVQGAVDTSDFLTSQSAAAVSIPVVSATADTTLGTTYNGKLVNANPTGGVFTLTLDQATTLGANWNVEIRNAATNSNVVKIVSTQNIAHAFGSRNALSLRPGESMIIRCDGATFMVSGYVPPLIHATFGMILIASRVSAAPGSPNPGDRYIATAIFTSGGVTTAVGDIIEATGQGTFIKITPATNCGWVAYVQDEAVRYEFVASAWVQMATSLATQAIMETGTSNAYNVSPGRQKYHPGHPKGWCYNDAGGFAAASSNVSSVTDSATGKCAVNLTTAFSGTSWDSPVGISNASPQVLFITSKSATAMSLEVTNMSSVNADPSFYNSVMLGDQ